MILRDRTIKIVLETYEHFPKQTTEMDSIRTNIKFFMMLMLMLPKNHSYCEKYIMNKERISFVISEGNKD